MHLLIKRTYQSDELPTQCVARFYPGGVVNLVMLRR
jgi:hypothetical protein